MKFWTEESEKRARGEPVDFELDDEPPPLIVRKSI